MHRAEIHKHETEQSTHTVSTIRRKQLPTENGVIGSGESSIMRARLATTDSAAGADCRPRQVSHWSIQLSLAFPHCKNAIREQSCCGKTIIVHSRTLSVGGIDEMLLKAAGGGEEQARSVTAISNDSIDIVGTYHCTPLEALKGCTLIFHSLSCN
jgi:hypothetical protein